MSKKYFLLLCSVLLFFALSSQASDNNVIRRHRKGLRRPTHKEQTYIAKKTHALSLQPNNFAAERFAKALSSNRGLLVSSYAVITNLQYMPPVGNQGNLGSCAAWSSCYYVKTYQEAKEHDWTDIGTNLAHRMSPAFGYNLANDGVDEGSDPNFIMQLMCDHGCTTMSDMFVSSATADFISWPTASQWKSAITYRADTASIIDLSTNSGITTLKQLVASGNIAVLGLEAFENLEFYPKQDPYDTTVTISTNNVMYAISAPYDRLGYSTDEGGHAMTVIGYDDTITFKTASGQQRSGAFLLVNQWGTDWGINISSTASSYAIDTSTGGFIWLSYDYVKNLSVYKQAYVMTDRSGYTPTTFGTFSLNDTERGDLDIKFMGGTSSQNPDWNFDCLPNIGGRRAVNQQIYVDLSDYPINYSNPFWLGVDDSTGTQTGQVTYMSVIKPNGTELTSANVPKNTVKSSNIYVELNQFAEKIVKLNLPSGPVTVDVPANAFNQAVTIQVTSTTAPSTAANNIEFTALAINIDSGGNQPSKLVTITISYRDQDLPSGFDKNRLAIARYDNTNNRWIPLTSTAGPGANQVTCETDHLSTFALVELIPSNNIASVKAYPNPFRPTSTLAQGVTIANLTTNCDVKIYSIAGQLMRTLNYSNGSGQVMWDGRNNSGNMVASGVYIIYINSPAGTKTLKIGVEK